MILKYVLDAVMERRARQQLEFVREWLPLEGPVLDLGSGTGHLAALMERETRLEVIPADVTDMHVVGRAPSLVPDGVLPWADGSFSAVLLLFMLGYPTDPVAVLKEAARVTRGPIILVQTVYSNRLGYVWHRGREFFWTYVAFHVSAWVGYVPRGAKFTMGTRRFYTESELRRDVTAAGLSIRARGQRPVLPGGALVVTGWMLGRND